MKAGGGQGAMSTRRVPIIGVVGGIGSGKSEFSRALESEGCVRLEADRVGHEMLRKAEVYGELVLEFGREILGPDGQIERGRLAAKAFGSEAGTETLNRIVGGALWPELRRRALEAADHAGPGAAAVVLDAALIYESGTDEICDSVVFVEAPDEDRRRRVKETRGWDWEEVERRESRQIGLRRKRKMADEVCENVAGLDHLRGEARRVLAKVRERFFSPHKQSADVPGRQPGGLPA